MGNSWIVKGQELDSEGWEVKRRLTRVGQLENRGRKSE